MPRWPVMGSGNCARYQVGIRGATIIFLDINGVWVEEPDDDAYDLVIGVASGRLSLAKIAEVLARWH